MGGPQANEPTRKPSGFALSSEILRAFDRTVSRPLSQVAPGQLVRFEGKIYRAEEHETLTRPCVLLRGFGLDATPPAGRCGGWVTATEIVELPWIPLERAAHEALIARLGEARAALAAAIEIARGTS